MEEWILSDENILNGIRCIHLFIQRGGQILKDVSRMGLLGSPIVGVRYLREQAREIQESEVTPHKSLFWYTASFN